MRLKQGLVAILAGVVLLGMLSFPAFAADTWDGSAIDKSWYHENDESFIISTGAGLAGLAALVNDGTDFSKKTITLGDDIDLGNHPWTPIGKSGKAFKGTFDGNGKTISNLYIPQNNKNDVGLFGFTQEGAVKNFTLTNVEIAGYLDVGAVAGTPYTSTYTDITVNGLVKVEGFAYVGGAFGKNVYADITNVDINADAGSLVLADSIDNEGAWRTYIGGLIGFMGEGKHTIKDCDVAIDVSGNVCDIGGITGILHYQNKMENCTYTGSLNLEGLSPDEPDNEEFGALCGTFNIAENSPASVPTITGCSATVISATLAGQDITNSLSPYGAYYNRNETDSAYDTGKTLVVENTTYNSQQVASPATDFEIVRGTETFQYYYWANAWNAAQDGDTVRISSDIDLGTSDALRIGKAITLQGVVDADGALPQVTGSMAIESGNVTIDGLQFTDPIVIPAFDVEPTCIAINTGNYDNVTVQDCVFATDAFERVDGKRYKGITTSSAGTYANLTIAGNTFKNVETAVTINPGVSDLTVTENTVDQEGVIDAFVKVHAVDGADITNNSVGQGSIYIRPDFTETVSSTDVTISGNDLSNAYAMVQMDKAGQEVSAVDLNANYWGGGLPASYKVPAGAEIESYYANVDQTTGAPTDLVTVPADLTLVSKSAVIEQNGETNEFYLYLQGTLADGSLAEINHLVAAQLNISVSGQNGEAFGINQIVPAANWEVQQVDGGYLIHEKGYVDQDQTPNPDSNYDLSGAKILLATLTIGGYGDGTITVADGVETIQQRNTDNIVFSSDLTGAAQSFTFSKPTHQLTVHVTFPNAVAENEAGYQAMSVTISGGDLTAPQTYSLGTATDDSSVAMQNGQYTVVADLTENTLYTVTVSGAGYRTARYTVNMKDADKTLTFWNNAKDQAEAIEAGSTNTVTTNFLAGDILADNQINLYDLSAVVSYFGADNLTVDHPEYAKYDLNRDGKIDSKDVAYVLVSWGK